MNKRQISIFFIVFALVILVTGCLFKCGKISESAPSTEETLESIELNENITGPYKVEYVIDGDTIIVNMDGEKVHIRLIGIDAPESASKDESRNNEYGQLASDYLKNLLSDKDVYLEYDEEKTDMYDRTLAYVYFINDQGELTMANTEMVKNGYAWTLTFEPNVKYKETFESAYEEAEVIRQIPEKSDIY